MSLISNSQMTNVYPKIYKNVFLKNGTIICEISLVLIKTEHLALSKNRFSKKVTKSLKCILATNHYI